MVRETGVQFLVEPYQRLKTWYLMLLCLENGNFESPSTKVLKCTLLNSVQFSISTQFSFIQMLPLRAKVDLEAMAVKGYSVSPKLQHYWNLSIRLFSVISRTLVGGGVTLCRDSVGVFYSPSWLGNGRILFEFLMTIILKQFREKCRFKKSIFTMANSRHIKFRHEGNLKL